MPFKSFNKDDLKQVTGHTATGKAVSSSPTRGDIERQLKEDGHLESVCVSEIWSSEGQLLVPVRHALKPMPEVVQPKEGIRSLA